MTTRTTKGAAPKIIGADFPILTSRYPLESLLNAYKGLCAERTDVRLVLAGARRPEEDYSVWNFFDANNLAGRVDFHQVVILQRVTEVDYEVVEVQTVGTR